MRPFVLKIFALVALLVIMPGQEAFAGGPFVGPKEGPPSFRRDLIPLEIEGIRRLSGSLSTMAFTIKDDSAENRRLAAQCISLSLALNVGNNDAKRLLKAWEEGRYRPSDSVDSSDVGKALRYTAGLIGWLEDKSAGRDANLLALCLRDVVSRVGSSNDEYRKLGEEQMIGDWTDFVPALTAYKDKNQPSVPDPDPGTNSVPAPDTREFALAFESSEITIPMWYRAIKPENGQSWVLKPGRMFVRAEYDKQRKHEPFQMQVGDNIYNEEMRAFTTNISGILHQSLGGLPGGLRVQIGSEALDEALRSGQPQSLSAAAVVLAGAVVRGQIPDPDTIVIGKVDAEGNYLPSSDMWEKLKAFDKVKGQRLVVPVKARQYFDAMLTMDQIKYFLDYEVVTASNVEELINAAAAEPEGELGDASNQFAEIQKVAPKGSNIRSFVANSHVRKRLAAVVKTCPTHLSGELLLMQANSSRKFNITREVLCAELKYILKPFGQIYAINWEDAAERNYRRLPIADMIKEARDQIAALERYVGREERDLYQAADLFLAEMREYDKALNQRGEYDFITGVLVRSSNAAREAYDNYTRMLDEAGNP